MFLNSDQRPVVSGQKKADRRSFSFSAEDPRLFSSFFTGH